MSAEVVDAKLAWRMAPRRRHGTEVHGGEPPRARLLRADGGRAHPSARTAGGSGPLLPLPIRRARLLHDPRGRILRSRDRGPPGRDAARDARRADRGLEALRRMIADDRALGDERVSLSAVRATCHGCVTANPAYSCGLMPEAATCRRSPRWRGQRAAGSRPW